MADEKQPDKPTRKQLLLLEMLDTVVANVELGLHLVNPVARSAHLKSVIYHWLDQAYDLGEEAALDSRITIDKLKTVIKRLRKINRELIKRISDERNEEDEDK